MFSSESARKIALVLYAFLMPVEVWAGEPSRGPDVNVTVRVAAEVTAHVEAVALGSVATIYANDEKDFQTLAGLMISQFPSGQTEMHLPKSYLFRRIQEALPTGTVVRLNAPDQILLRLERKGITSEELAEAITRRARQESKIPDWVETEVEILSGQDSLKDLKLEDMRLEPAGIVSQWKGELSFKLTEANVSNSAPRWIRARIRWFGHVWAARHALSLSQAPSAADFEITRLELTALREEVVGATESVENVLRGARLRRPLAAKSALFKAALERKPDAKPGQNLKVVFISENGIRVSADGSLLGAGAIGDEVKARLRSSRKIVTGRLVESGTVEVSL